ncbi:outer membrane transport energization protein TonB [Halospina denitrificans]|uniref:Outer membrane transport energization protein TonB n=1 Tax=Halospina denitrificans TaxID=332522 RepID=A0A4R7JH00_9GAMM|nr:AgmX/PglI C-terminal domain-containing protein [Halospina denitrificans]TDT37091.1 outer membrane transport energization protein TonB [Halospina denitrificans]
MSREDSSGLPWGGSGTEDRLLGLITLVLLVFFLPVAVLIPMLDVPEPTPEEREEVPPQMARMVDEPEPVEPEEPEPEPEQEAPEPAEEPEPEPEPQPEPDPEAVEEAREVASESGLVGMKDQLSDLRELADSGPTELRSPDAEAAASDDSAQSSGPDREEVLADSGGAETLSEGQTEEGELARREARELEGGQQASQQAETEPDERPMANIRETFENNKSALFSIYNRARRRNPLLEGELVLELRIAPNGRVNDVSIVDSELENSDLEQRIVQRVTLFNFGAMDVPERTVRFPVDFAPPS